MSCRVRGVGACVRVVLAEIWPMRSVHHGPKPSLTSRFSSGRDFFLCSSKQCVISISRPRMPGETDHLRLFTERTHEICLQCDERIRNADNIRCGDDIDIFQYWRRNCERVEYSAKLFIPKKLLDRSAKSMPVVQQHDF